jgi:hydrogenase nickel incorporation protein HypA/HybF
MHEMSICQSVVQILEEQSRTASFSKVKKVRLEIGCFAGVEPEALHFGFDAVARGTVAEGAALEIVELSGRAWCFDCSESFEVGDRLADCPRCGGSRLSVTGGDELRIKDLEVV